MPLFKWTVTCALATNVSVGWPPASTIALATSAFAQPTVIYVDSSAIGNNDGTTWADAFGDLQDALAAAGQKGGIGLEIWVAAGTYTPGPPDSGPQSFHLVSGAALYGGFAGRETRLDQRDWKKNETILRGVTEGSDWSNVLRGEGLESGSILDGFTIRAGLAAEYWDNVHGGGLRLEQSTLAIANCTFTLNWAEFGGGIYAANSMVAVANVSFQANGSAEGGAIYGTGSTIVLDRCVFHSNSAYVNAGAIKTLGADSLVIATECSFVGNDDGAMSLAGVAILERCSFIENAATFTAGAIAAFGTLQLRECMFTSNISGGSALRGSGHWTITDTSFLANDGAIEFTGGLPLSQLSIAGSEFLGNHSAFVGGGIAIDGAVELTIDDSLFEDNYSTFAGGAIWIGIGAEAVIRNTRVTGNEAAAAGHEGGGGIYAQSPITLINCDISDNFSLYTGGVHQAAGDLIMINCNLTDNFAEAVRVGSWQSSVDATIINSTIANNAHSIYPRNGHIQVLNSILWGSQSTASCQGLCGGAAAACYCDELCCEMNDCCFDKHLHCAGCAPEFGTIEVSHSIVQGLPPHDTGDDPLFVDPANGDYRLQPGSPAIDAGSNAFLPADITTDLDGNPRIMDGSGDGIAIVDLGAYEFQPMRPGIPGDLNGDGVVNVEDLLILLASWGPCPDCPPIPGTCPANLNGDCNVGVPDLLILLANWG